VGVNFQGVYYDDWVFVAKNYLSGSFAFDVSTSIPVSYIELMANAACSQLEGGAAPSQELRFVRALKPLRWFKLARVMKLNKSGDVLAIISDYLMLSPKRQRSITVLLSIFGAIHLGACGAFLIKVLFAADETEVTSFLISQSPDANNPIDLGTAEGKVEAYILCAYFIMTVFSTVGFGDISGSNTGERAMLIFLMLWGVLTFGNIMAELAEINHASNSTELEKLAKVQHAVDFMCDFDVPNDVQMQVLQWTRFAHDHQSHNVKRKDLLQQLPPNIQRELVSAIYGEVRHVCISLCVCVLLCDSLSL